MEFRALNNPEYRAAFEHRFWAKVDRTAGAEHCWPWQGAKLPKGYGKIGITHSPYCYSEVYAHRAAFYLFIGEELGVLCVLHKCDNPPCCNPRHLFLGTQADNHRDMVSKGRNSKGERSGNSKLTAQEVEEIRAKYQRGIVGYVKLAAQYGASPSHIRTIVLNRSWKHLSNSDEVKGSPNFPPGTLLPHAKLSDSDVLRILALYRSGQASARSLAKEYQVRDTYIHALVAGKARKRLTVPCHVEQFNSHFEKQPKVAQLRRTA